jgi:hypothetical protein
MEMEMFIAGFICLFIGIIVGVVLVLMLACTGHIKLEDIHIG